MSKTKIKFFCQECGYETSAWMGKCPGCSSWNTLVEELISKPINTRVASTSNKGNKPLSLPQIEQDSQFRERTGIDELDRVLGGGLVQGSLVLIAGDPGIGKSTLLLQGAAGLALKNKKILYISGEESAPQIKERANRLGINNDNIIILTETDVTQVINVVETIGPSILIIDSIQTLYAPELTSAPGSVSQVREIAARMMFLAKQKMISTFLIGHVTKEGSIAGPRVLEHMVDTVLYFEGEKHYQYRILRAVKNRFGSTNEAGIFEMDGFGLKEVINPSQAFLAERPQKGIGSIVTCSVEGTRALLLEIQALVCQSQGNGRRVSTGTDFNRMAFILAVLDKKVGMQLSYYDAYINIVGGLKVDEPAIDLAVATAVASSFRNKSISMDTVVIGEVGLTGEVRGINQIEKRLIEAQKMGFRGVVIPYSNKKKLQGNYNLEIVGVRTIVEALATVLGG